MTTAILFALTLVSLWTVRPEDGGNHPRKDQSVLMAQHMPRGFHPAKEWESDNENQN